MYVKMFDVSLHNSTYCLLLNWLSLHLYFATAAVAYSNAFYGQGSGPILMDNVTCTGVESGLINCTFSNHTSDCRHSEDAGVRCYSPPSTGEYI